MKTKFVLSGGIITKKNDGKDFLLESIKGFKEPVRILDCLFSRPRKTWQNLFEEDKMFYKERLDKKFILELAYPEKFVEQVKNNDVIFLRGGSTDELVDALGKNLAWTNFLDGKTIAGTSAGTDAIAKYYSNLDGHGIGEGLDLLPIKVIVHWDSDYNSSKIKWKERLKELKNFGGNFPVYKLREGEFIVLTSNTKLSSAKANRTSCLFF